MQGNRPDLVECQQQMIKTTGKAWLASGPGCSKQDPEGKWYDMGGVLVGDEKQHERVKGRWEVGGSEIVKIKYQYEVISKIRPGRRYPTLCWIRVIGSEQDQGERKVVRVMRRGNVPDSVDNQYEMSRTQKRKELVPTLVSSSTR